MHWKQGSVVVFNVVEHRLRHKEVSAGIAYLCLDVTFFMTRIWVAKSHGKAVMGTHSGKELRFMDDFADPPADTGGIVEDHYRRYTAYIGKDVLESLADAFRSFPAEHLCKTVIAVGKREAKVLLANPSPAFQKIRFAEVGLAFAGVPDQFHARTHRELFLKDTFYISLNGIVGTGIAWYF